jgi:DNA-binding transcriptional LysR family regulator
MSTIRFLRTFLAVEKYGSFAAAAGRVALTQAAVGQQMRALEEEFRRPLFYRSGRVITLTPAARALIPQARKLVAAYEAMLADGDTGHEIAGSITVGAIVSAMGFLSENLISLKAQYPTLDVRLVLGHTGELAEQVTASEIDAALTVQIPYEMPANLQWTPLYEEPLMLIASTRVATAQADVASLLKSQPFLRFDRTSPTGAKVEQTLRRMRIKPKEILEVNSVAAIIDLVRQNVGISIVPLLKHVAWTRDHSLIALQLPYGPLKRVIGMLENDRQLEITAVVRQKLLQTLA